MKYIKTYEGYDSYEEIVFVGYNSEMGSSTTKVSQLALYKELQGVNGLMPHIQNWDDNQSSLSVIILNQKFREELMPLVKKLAAKHGIEIDNVNTITGDKVDSIKNRGLDNLQTNESYDDLPIKVIDGSGIS